jgi:hypothetical protein
MTDHLYQWLFVIICLSLATYTAIVIKKEKSIYLIHAKDFPFVHFLLKIPSWWTFKEDCTSTRASFYRSDTHYDWSAKFEWFSALSLKKIESLNILTKIIEEKGISFDEGILPFRPFDLNPFEVIRMEGTATNNEDLSRLYYDIFILIDLNKEGYLVCESQSSVLNGLIEGPFFDEVIKRIEVRPS